MTFNFNLMGLNGQSILSSEDGQPINAGRLLGNNLYMSKIPDRLKWNPIAQKMFNGEDFVLDNSDMQKLKDYIEKQSGFSNGIVEQLLNVIT